MSRQSAGRLGAFTFVAVIVYQFVMFGVVAPALFGVTREVLDDPVKDMASTSEHRLVVVAVYLGPIVAAFAINAVLVALRQTQMGSLALADAACLAATIGSVAAILEASTVIVGIPVLAGWYQRDPSAAIAGMVTQQALSNGLHMLTFFGWGLAILLASVAALRERTLPPAIAAYGLLAGFAGVTSLLTVDPAFFTLLVFVPWFALVGWKLSAREGEPTTRPV
jgi:hypothetical protein